MHRTTLIVAFIILTGLIVRSSAQSTPNVVPKYNSEGGLVPSAIREIGANVGISAEGTEALSARLTVSTTNLSQHVLSLIGFNTGTGLGGIYAIVNFLNTHDGPNSVTGFRFQHNNAAGSPRTSASIESSLNDVTQGSEDGWLAFSTAKNGGSEEKVRIDSDGNMGVGISAPSAKLHVAGGAQFDGNVLVNGNIAAKFQDVAEWVESVSPIDDGTVVVVDSAAANHVKPSTRAYDTLVAGAISRQPGIVLGEAGARKELVAQSGRVRVKVDATYGAIVIGDLLVTSPTPGHAMRSAPVDVGGVPMHRPGTLLGKALETLRSGKGEILVLLTLQ